MLRASLLLALFRAALGAGADDPLVQLVGQASAKLESDAAAKGPGYQPGDVVEAIDKRQGWIPCAIVGRGQKPGTFDLAVPRMGVAKDVPHRAIRPAVPHKNGTVVEVLDAKTSMWIPAIAVTYSKEQKSYTMKIPYAGILPGIPALAVRRVRPFRAGEEVEVMFKAGMWTAAVLKGNGTAPRSYLLASFGEEDKPYEVPAVAVRRVWKPQSRERVHVFIDATNEWVNGTIIKNGTKKHTYILVAKGLGVLKDLPRAILRRAPQVQETVVGEKLFKGEVLEFLDRKTNLFVPGTLQANGSQKETFNLEIPYIGMVYDVSVLSLRRLANKYPGDLVEVLDLKTGIWVSGEVIGEGLVKNTYDIYVPLFGTFPDVPKVRIRRYNKPRTGDIMEVYNPRKDQWNPCKIMGPGQYNITYNIYMRKVGQVDDIAEPYLRRVARPRF